MCFQRMPAETDDMTTVRKTITLTDQHEAWIRAQVAHGRYANDSECIRDLVRREQERTAEADTIRAALIEGEVSGEAQRFGAAAFKARMRRRG